MYSRDMISATCEMRDFFFPKIIVSVVDVAS